MALSNSASASSFSRLPYSNSEALSVRGWSTFRPADSFQHGRVDRVIVDLTRIRSDMPD
jgi:hypothetical protein